MSQSNYRPQRPQQRPAAPGRRPAMQQPGRPVQGRPGAQPPRPAAPRPRPARQGGRLPYGLGKLLLACVLIAAIGVGLQMLWPKGFPVKKAESGGAAAQTAITEIHSKGPIRINELMTANRNCLSIADGSTPDWVEIANISANSVNIGGYQLSKGANDATVFTFPQIWLEPDECVLVYCDSRLRQEENEDLHAPFRLSSAGDTLMLFNASDTAVDTLNIPSLVADQSYIRTGTSTWAECSTPTPGLPNTEESYRSLNEVAADSPIVINELMSTNKSTIAAEDGQYYDYIELYNRSDAAVELGGWYLSDDSLSVRKWRFPEVSIGPGEYLLVYASKLDHTEDAADLHAGFSLSSEGESVVLSNEAGRVMDRVEFDLLKADVAWNRQYDGSFAAGAGTPGSAN